jgi:hypothetical protein
MFNVAGDGEATPEPLAEDVLADEEIEARL